MWGFLPSCRTLLSQKLSVPAAVLSSFPSPVCDIVGDAQRAYRYGDSAKCCTEKTLFADRRSQSAGGPPDRFRRGRPESLFGPPGTDQREVQGGCQNGQRWLASRCGNPAKCCSEKMPFAGRRSWLVKPCLMDLLYISPFIRGGPPFGEVTEKVLI